jgi:glycerol-3-phosphate acyltransferase PlsY
VVFLVGRYVSLASIAAAAVLPVSATLLSILEVYPTPWVIVIFLYLLAILAILRHTSNIRRLLNGTENRFDKKKKSETKEEQEEKSDENSSSE